MEELAWLGADVKAVAIESRTGAVVARKCVRARSRQRRQAGAYSRLRGRVPKGALLCGLALMRHARGRRRACAAWMGGRVEGSIQHDNFTLCELCVGILSCLHRYQSLR